LRILWGHLRVAHTVREHETTTQRYLNRFASTDPRRMSDDEVWSVIEDWVRDSASDIQTVLLLSGVSFHEAPVRKVCEKVGFVYEHLVYPQLAIGKRSVSAQQAFDLMELVDIARREPAVVQYLTDEASDWSKMRVALRGTAFLTEFERFLETYGHRGRYESDWSLPRYSEDPTALLVTLRVHLKSGSEST